jgi:hypothetical protein
MSNVIQFLEAMGSNSAVARMGAFEYETAVDALDLLEKERLSLRARDESQLRNAMDVVMPMYCLIASPNEQEGEKVPDQENDDDAPNGNEPPVGN